MTTAEQPQVMENEVQMKDNDYLVAGHLDGWHNNVIEYVQSPTAVEAEDIFREWIQHEYLAAGVEVFFDHVVQIPGPPIAIFDDDGVRENIKPIQRPKHDRGI